MRKLAMCSAIVPLALVAPAFAGPLITERVNVNLREADGADRVVLQSRGEE